MSLHLRSLLVGAKVYVFIAVLIRSDAATFTDVIDELAKPQKKKGKEKHY